MIIFVLLLTGYGEIYNKTQITINFKMKRLIFAILGHFWPVFGLSWPRYQFPKLSLSIFDLVLTGLREISENDNENANFGYFRVIFGLL